MNLRTLLFVGIPLGLFLYYLMELVYYKGLDAGRREGYDYGREDGILEVKELLDGDDHAKDK